MWNSLKYTVKYCFDVMEWKQRVEKTNNLTIVNFFETIFWRSLILFVGATDTGRARLIRSST